MKNWQKKTKEKQKQNMPKQCKIIVKKNKGREQREEYDVATITGTEDVDDIKKQLNISFLYNDSQNITLYH